MVHVHHNPHRDDDVETEVALEEQEDMNNMLSIGHHMNTTSSAFLHTIPEDSSNIGGQDSSSFNPAAVALGGLSPTHSTTASAGGKSSSSSSSPWAMMKVFRASGQAAASHSSTPLSPPSVTSSTNAVQAGHGMGLDSSVTTGYGMDGSNTAVRAGDEESNGNNRTGAGGGAPSTTFAIAGYETDPTAINPNKKRRRSIVSRRKVGVVASLAAVLILVVVIALVFIVASINKAGDGAEAGSETNETALALADGDTLPTQSPSQAGTIYVPTYGLPPFDDDDDASSMMGTTEDESVVVHLEDAIRMLYSANNMLAVVSEDVFSDNTDARYQARSWMMNNDTHIVSVIAESDPTEPDALLRRIAQRYIMTVFYFSTHADTNSNGVDNNTRRREQRQRGIQSKEGTCTFEIESDVHECYWLENACGQDTAAAAAALNGDPTAMSTRVEDVSMDASIVYVNASHCNLVGTLPFELEYLTDLEKLAIHGNSQLQGTIPEQIANQWQSLYVLDLSDNALEGSIPPSIWTLPKLRFAYLHENRFVGTIPASLSALYSLTASPVVSTDLKKLWLGNNSLSGEIPVWWAEELPALEQLSVGNNSFTGPLPSNWSFATNLGFVDASWNQLTGSVPYSLLYGVPTLRMLYLDYNELSGGLVVSAETELQNELGLDFTVSVRSFSLMERLWLQNNQLTGTVPRGFGWDWDNLRELELHDNQLTGIWDCMDEGSDVWPQLEDLSIDCFGSPILTAVSATSVNNIEAVEGAGGGVDMSMCSACCIRCS